MFANTDTKWTNGPSFPRFKPEETAKANPMIFVTNVHADKYPRMTTPLSTVLISGTPEPAACGANLLTNLLPNHLYAPYFPFYC